jgi:hypothetical protein
VFTIQCQAIALDNQQNEHHSQAIEKKTLLMQLTAEELFSRKEMEKKRKKKSSSKSGKMRTPIDKHAHSGKHLNPPFVNEMGAKLNLSSWMNQRLPEMLWVALILSHVDREYAFAQFRRIFVFIGKHERRAEFHDLTLSGIAALDEELRRELIAFITEPPEAKEALATLTLFSGLPAKEDWSRYTQKSEGDIDLLIKAVGATLWHQSQDSTDCRWVRLMGKIVCGMFHYPPNSPMREQIMFYPGQGDLQTVRPSIRASELVLDRTSDISEWSNGFWQEAWEKSPCISVNHTEKAVKLETLTRDKYSFVHSKLLSHWQKTHSKTAIDARHDAVFGMALFSMKILWDMFGISIGNSILGRLGLRTILEIRINLSHLLAEDKTELWQEWRRYGSGQAKLNSLKFDEIENAPEYASIENLEAIANEDIWEEFLPVNLGHWDSVDLRKLSIRTGLKDLYDEYYSWTSAYAHGSWGAIRESCFSTCGNPLHRLHRLPHDQNLNDTLNDAARLVDQILEELGNAYPDFNHRLMCE